MPSSLKKTRAGNPLASKSQLQSRANALNKVSQTLSNAVAVESHVKEGLRSDEYESFTESADSAIKTLNGAVARIRGRLSSGKHN